MSYSVKSIVVFERQAKRLKKKFPSLKKEIFQLIQELKIKPNQGSPLGHNCFKVRLAISSKGKGKSGGARIITYLKIIEHSIYLLSIYDKSEQKSLTEKELLKLIELIQ